MGTTGSPARRHPTPCLLGAVVLTAAVLTVGGCGASDDEPGAPSSSEPSASATTAPATALPTDAPTGASTAAPPPGALPPREPTAGAFTAPGTELTHEPQDGLLTVVDVRVGAHDGYERVVYELAGEGLPGWRIAYVDEAVDDPSGEVVDVAGDATLQVVLLGAGYPMDTGFDEYAHDVTATGGVQQVTRPLTFEGQTQSFVGLDAERPLRVTLLADPVRVVVDVQSP